MGENINYTSNDKGLFSKICKKLLQLTTKPSQIPQFKNRQSTWIDIYPKKTYKWSTGIWNDVQHRSIIREIQIKPQWDSTLQPLGWLLSKTQDTASVSEDVYNSTLYSCLVRMQKCAPII
jgi:hypothetical protein